MLGFGRKARETITKVADTTARTIDKKFQPQKKVEEPYLDQIDQEYQVVDLA